MSQETRRLDEATAVVEDSGQLVLVWSGLSFWTCPIDGLQQRADVGDRIATQILMDVAEGETVFEWIDRQDLSAARSGARAIVRQAHNDAEAIRSEAQSYALQTINDSGGYAVETIKGKWRVAIGLIATTVLVVIVFIIEAAPGR